jgi:hypothetical protein
MREYALKKVRNHVRKIVKRFSLYLNELSAVTMGRRKHRNGGLLLLLRYRYSMSFLYKIIERRLQDEGVGGRVTDQMMVSIAAQVKRRRRFPINREIR